MLADLHTHCEYSPDSDAPLEDMLAAAHSRNIGVYAVTDHVDLCHEWEQQSLSRTLPESFAAVTAAKAKAQAARTDFRLLAGIELGQPVQRQDMAEQILASYGFDFVIGSLHKLPDYPDFYDVDYTVGADALVSLFNAYYAELLRMVDWGKFDALAHITYPYRYLNEVQRGSEAAVHPEQFDAEADAVLKALVDRGISLELNTGSLSRSEEDAALNIRYFRRYRELGGSRVTIGSDAHAPERVGQGIPAACELLYEIGFREITYYEKRVPKVLPITCGITCAPCNHFNKIELKGR